MISQNSRELRIQSGTAGILALPISLLGWALRHHPDLGALAGVAPAPVIQLGSWFSVLGGLVLVWAVLCWLSLVEAE